MGLNRAQNEVFHHLLKFGSYVFLEIAYNDNLPQCQTSSRGKIHEKKLGALVCAKQAITGPENRFFDIFSSLVH